MTETNNHTFVVLAHCESPFLDDCLQSLKRQTHKSDILVATSTPSAFIERAAKKYSASVVINEYPGGISGDWSFALRSARTKYVTLAHQDDIYFPEYTEQCLKRMRVVKDALILFTDYAELVGNTYLANNVNKILKKILLSPFLLKKSFRSSFWRKGLLILGNSFCCPSVMYNRENIGEFEFSKDFAFNLDWDAWLRLASSRGSFTYINKRLMAHRIHASSQTTLCDQNGKRLDEERKLFERLWPSPLARVLSCVYALGARSNRINERGPLK